MRAETPRRTSRPERIAWAMGERQRLAVQTNRIWMGSECSDPKNPKDGPKLTRRSRLIGPEERR
jgi:hypothetical protein